MLKKQLRLYLIVALGFLYVGTASAATVSLSPINPNVGIGDSVFVELSISGLGTGLGSDILSVFDLNIGFDDSILGFQSFAFGTDLDLGLALSIQDVDDITFGPGIVNVSEFSLLSDVELISLQPDTFLLGTFTFEALSIGAGALTIAENFGLGLVGANFGPLLADLEVSGSVSVVPVPAAIWLFGTGMIGLLGFCRRRKMIR